MARGGQRSLYSSIDFVHLSFTPKRIGSLDRPVNPFMVNNRPWHCISWRSYFHSQIYRPAKENAPGLQREREGSVCGTPATRKIKKRWGPSESLKEAFSLLPLFSIFLFSFLALTTIWKGKKEEMDGEWGGGGQHSLHKKTPGPTQLNSTQLNVLRKQQSSWNLFLSLVSTFFFFQLTNSIFGSQLSPFVFAQQADNKWLMMLLETTAVQ